MSPSPRSPVASTGAGTSGAASRSALASAAEPVVRSLLETVVSAELGVDTLDGVTHLDEATEVLMHKLTHMPTHLGLGMQGLTLVFDAAGALTGRPFRMKSLPARRRQLAVMKGAPVGLLRDFVAFYEKMGSFVYYSILEEAGEHLPAAHGS